MKISIARFGALSVLLASACTHQIGEERPLQISANGYDGTYDIRDNEVRYHVPRGLIGPAIFTHANVQFHDASDLRVFSSSFRSGNGGISLGLSPYPARLLAKRELSDYVAYYQQHAEERGLSAMVSAEEISRVMWMRIEERYKNSRLARVIFVTPAFSDYMLVCRIGLSDDLDPETKVTWNEWMPAISEVVNSIHITKK